MISPEKERAGEATPAHQPSNAPGPVKSMHPTRDHRPDDEHEPDDPRAAERLRVEQAEPVETDERARASLLRAISRARLAWPSGPSPELREWVHLAGLCVGGREQLAMARTRALAAGAVLTLDELVLAAAGLASATPGLVAAHLERAAHEGRAGRVA